MGDAMTNELGVRTPGPTGETGRRVVASTFMTLDGYMVGRDEDMSWVVADFDREMQADIAKVMSSETDVFVFGRLTYARSSP